jgi:hypothetical protein
MIIPGGAGLCLQSDALGIGCPVGFHVLHPVDRLQRRAERGRERTAECKTCGVAQQMVDGDRTPRIAGTLPRCDGCRPIEREPALVHQNPGQRRHHRLRCGEAEQRGVDAATLGIALRDDAAVADDDHRTGAAERRRVGLGEGAIDRGRELRRRGHDRRRPGDVGQQRRLQPGFVRRQRGVRDRDAVIEIATHSLAVDGMTAAEAEQRHRNIPAGSIDLVVERPADQAGSRHRRHGLGENLVRIQSGHKGFRAENAGGEAGCNPRHVMRAYGGQRQRAAQGGGHKQDDLFRRGHGVLRLSPSWRAGDDLNRCARARRIWKSDW